MTTGRQTWARSARADHRAARQPVSASKVHHCKSGETRKNFWGVSAL